MLFDPNTFTLTRDLKNCTNCFAEPGTVATRIDCPTCGGTGKGLRGGDRGCKKCHGFRYDYDQDNRSTCPNCNGTPERAEMENWTDSTPVEALAALQLRVARQDRATSWNEQFLGLNCLWSTTDYGDAWEHTDLEVLTAVRGKLLADRTQASKLLACAYDRDAPTLPMVRGVVVVVSRNGYSVRTDTAAAENLAEREPDRTTAHIIGMTVFNAGPSANTANFHPDQKAANHDHLAVNGYPEED